MPDDNQPPQDEVTIWFKSLQEGDEQAATLLFEHCFPRLLRYTRARLPDHLRRALDEEDVALSAFKSFCTAARQGKEDIHNRDELWKLLTCITARKRMAYIRRETRQKRGGGKVRGESIFLNSEREENVAGIQQVRDENTSPATLAEFEDRCRGLLDSLGDETLQVVAMLRLEGYSVDEIADRVGCAKRSVERRLSMIRKIWSDFEDSPLRE